MNPPTPPVPDRHPHHYSPQHSPAKAYGTALSPWDNHQDDTVNDNNTSDTHLDIDRSNTTVTAASSDYSHPRRDSTSSLSSDSTSIINRHNNHDHDRDDDEDDQDNDVEDAHSFIAPSSVSDFSHAAAPPDILSRPWQRGQAQPQARGHHRASPSRSGVTEAGSPVKSAATPKGRFYGDLSAATRGIRQGGSPAQSPERMAGAHSTNNNHGAGMMGAVGGMGAAPGPTVPLYSHRQSPPKLMSKQSQQAVATTMSNSPVPSSYPSSSPGGWNQGRNPFSNRSSGGFGGGNGSPHDRTPTMQTHRTSGTDRTDWAETRAQRSPARVVSRTGVDDGDL
ncbi:hypothetical protein LTS18_013801, partial [Coniosporium uncinatum]